MRLNDPASSFLGATVLIVASAVACAKEYTVDRSIVYARPNGKTCRMTLHLPAGDTGARRPGVLLIHGGAWLFGTRHQLGWYGRHFARQGYVAASINYRMMPKYPFPSCLHDCKAAVRWMRLHADEYGLDPERIAVLGNSAGGHLSAMLATTAPEDGLEGADNPGASSRVQAAIVLYGVADLSYYRSPKGYVRFAGITPKFMERFVGTPQGEGHDPYDAASPATYAGRRTCPTLFVHGTKDNWVPYAQSVAFCQRLRRLGVPTRLIAVRHGHAFDLFHLNARRHLFDEIVRFLDEHLGAPARTADGEAP